MRTAILLTIVALAAVARTDGQRLPSSQTLDLSLAVDAVHSCRDDHGDAAEATVRLRFRNRGAVPVRVLPDTLRLTSVQVVRTVEEFVPLGPDTPGVRVLPVRPDTSGTKGAARLVKPGESIDVARRIAAVVASPHAAEAFALEPGHYFLELVASIEAAAPGDGRFTAQSIVSPYIALDLPAPARPCQDAMPPTSSS